MDSPLSPRRRGPPDALSPNRAFVVYAGFKYIFNGTTAVYRVHYSALKKVKERKKRKGKKEKEERKKCMARSGMARVAESVYRPPRSSFLSSLPPSLPRSRFNAAQRGGAATV